MIGGVTIGEIIRTGGLPHIRGLLLLPWVPHLHVNVHGNENKKVIGFYQQNKRLHVFEQKSKKSVNRLSLYTDVVFFFCSKIDKHASELSARERAGSART